MDHKVYLKATAASQSTCGTRQATLFQGDCLNLLQAMPDSTVDCVISSPPYCIGKAYEDTRSVADFAKLIERVLPDVIRVLKPGGSLCWQVGVHVKENVVVPLDYEIFRIMSEHKNMSLRNRIIWTFGHGLHAPTRFSGRHETVMWFTKDGAPYPFDLDSVRVPQKYPGKTHYKGKKKGQPSGNPLGKNPGDVWDDIPNVKANHCEKTEHPCQFPVALATRLIRALTPENGLVMDPFMGSGSTGVASILQGRRFVGAEVKQEYVEISSSRIDDAIKGKAVYRPEDQPVYVPDPKSSVARLPENFLIARSTGEALSDHAV